MTVGIDTYITAAEATEYISDQYVTVHPLRVHWSVLTDEEKDAYLKQALRRLENLTYVGDKISYTQPLKFPRRAYGKPYEWDKVPLNVKRAQAILALEIIRQEYVASADPRMVALVNPYRFVSKRETDTLAETVQGDTSALPDEVYELLHEWVISGRKI